MAKAGKRYSLLIYTRMIDRWWPAVFFLGVALIVLVYGSPFYQDLYTQLTEPLGWMIPAGVGVAVIAASLVMLAFRKGAYIQPLNDHFLLVTPFLRMKVSYRRILRTTTTTIYVLFPPKQMSGTKRDIIEPLSRRTAVVIELNALPLSRGALSLFLSPFFFKDDTPHLVILVQDWIGLSTDLDSMRMRVKENGNPTQPDRSILTRFPKE
jgi:hypothetical protein